MNLHIVSHARWLAAVIVTMNAAGRRLEAENSVDLQRARQHSPSTTDLKTPGRLFNSERRVLCSVTAS